ncbi:hypothetical protein GCM10027271_33600 [Saccharopolyspora gloriosae]
MKIALSVVTGSGRLLSIADPARESSPVTWSPAAPKEQTLPDNLSGLLDRTGEIPLERGTTGRWFPADGASPVAVPGEALRRSYRGR